MTSVVFLIALVLAFAAQRKRRQERHVRRRKARADRHTYEVTLEDQRRADAEARGLRVYEGGRD